MEIFIDLDSANGPKVVAPLDAGAAEILAVLPEGWTVNDDDWSNGVRGRSGGIAYPLSEVE